MRRPRLRFIGAVSIVVAMHTAACYGQGLIVRKPVKELIESVTEYFGKRGTREAAKQLADLGGEPALRVLLERVAREGGDDAAQRLVLLTKKFGPDIVRAAEVAPDASVVLKALDELPANVVSTAAKRLAAGAEGAALAAAVRKSGTKVLLAEVKHPGVGGRLVSSLGDDGAALAAKLNTNQAIELARHADDIALLPPPERAQIIALVRQHPEGMSAFMRRFVEQNPGKTLLTAATTPVILANSEAIFGGSQIVYDKAGQPVLVQKPGLIEKTLAPVSEGLYVVVFILVTGLCAFICILLWHAHVRARIKTAAIAAGAESQVEKPLRG